MNYQSPPNIGKLVPLIAVETNRPASPRELNRQLNEGEGKITLHGLRPVEPPQVGLEHRIQEQVTMKELV
jgi:hypothetical protein